MDNEYNTCYNFLGSWLSWDTWSKWTKCSGNDCGKEGTRSRNRTRRKFSRKDSYLDEVLNNLAHDSMAVYEMYDSMEMHEKCLVPECPGNRMYLPYEKQ